MDLTCAAREEESREQRLIAYVVPRENSGLTAPETRKFLSTRLPAQMVPAVLISVNPLPRTVHGKIDRQALPVLEENTPLTIHGAAPRDVVERTLQFIWQTILGVPAIGIHDNFFDYGGDSLAALQMIATVEKAFSKNIPPAALFASPTIEQLAALVGEHKPSDYWSSLVPVQPIGSKPPFFWIHGDSSSVFLSQHLGVDPPLLLNHQSEDGRPARFTEVKTIAEYYLREMRTIQKTGSVKAQSSNPGL